MIKSPIFIEEKNINIPSDVSKKIKNSLGFFLINKKDKRNVFISFVILEFDKEKITYIHSFSEQNENKLQKSQFDYRTFRGPHSIINVDNRKFLIFIEIDRFFYEFDLNEKILSIYEGTDIGLPNVKEFGATFYKEDGICFYMNTIEVIQGKKMQNYYKVSLDFKSIDFIVSKRSSLSLEISL